MNEAVVNEVMKKKLNIISIGRERTRSRLRRSDSAKLGRSRGTSPLAPSSDRLAPCQTTNAAITSPTAPAATSAPRQPSQSSSASITPGATNQPA
jgi:hypothetical protein